MRKSNLHRGTALAAKLAGLGMATAVVFAMGAAPGTALADEVPADANALTVSVGEAPQSQPSQSTQGTAQSEQGSDPTVTSASSKTEPSASDATEPAASSAAIDNAAPASAQNNGEEQASTPAASSHASGEGLRNEAEDSVPAAEETVTSGTHAQDQVQDRQGNEGVEQAEQVISADAQAATRAETTVAPVATVPVQNQSEAAASPEPVAPVAATAATVAADSTPAPTYTNVYRIYNPWSGEHLYTTSIDEATSDFGLGWQWEDAIYLEQSDGDGSAVYRLYNPYTGAHFYTQDADEYAFLATLGWRQEGTAFLASGSGLLHRLYNPWSAIGEHLYTPDDSEAAHLASIGWADEGWAWSYTPGRSTIQGRWVISSAYGSSQLYWVSPDTTLAKGRYVEPEEGSGFRAYAKEDGAVVRGFCQVDSSRGLVADANGALETGDGMVVTGKYTNGTLERYYLRDGFVTLGEFTYGGNNYFGRYDTGYVVRGNYFNPDTGKMYRGNNDGVLQARNSSVDRYVDWALNIAMDDRHGYSQIHRNGPDYDCSSMVIAALRQAGYRTGGASYTGNMYSELSRYGWYSVAPNRANLHYGDILLNDTHHTAIYLANGWLVQASSDENGSWQGYRSGDQTGREIYYRTYYNYPWTRFLRHS